MYHKPADHITFLEECLARARSSKDSTYDWDTFHKGEDNLSLASTVMSEINGKLKNGSSLTEDDPKKDVEMNKNNEEKLKAVVGKPILFVLGECNQVISNALYRST